MRQEGWVINYLMFGVCLMILAALIVFAFNGCSYACDSSSQSDQSQSQNQHDSQSEAQPSADVQTGNTVDDGNGPTDNPFVDCSNPLFGVTRLCWDGE